MRTIEVTQGHKALVDDEDFEWLNQYSWCIRKGHNTFYARTKLVKGVDRGTDMHRVILKTNNTTLWVDHKDGNGLNNQKSNLRICNRSLNQANRKINKNNRMGYRGVYLDTERKRVVRYIAQIGFNGKRIKIGRFHTKEEAALAYNNKALALFGEFATLNKV